MRCLSKALYQTVWIGQYKKGDTQGITESILEQLAHAQRAYMDGVDNKSSIRSLESSLESRLFQLYYEFKSWGRSVSPTFQYWDSCRVLIELLLHNIRSLSLRASPKIEADIKVSMSQYTNLDGHIQRYYEKRQS